VDLLAAAVLAVAVARQVLVVMVVAVTVVKTEARVAVTSREATSHVAKATTRMLRQRPNAPRALRETASAAAHAVVRPAN
jgi:predicted solute-binding protein